MTLRFLPVWSSLLLLATTTTPARAQQTPNSLFYRSNWQFVNPAAIDRSHYLSRKHNQLVLNGGFRQQWIGLDDAPMLYYVSAEYCPEIANREVPGSKFGITAFGDQTDAIGTYGFYGNYSYFFPIPYTQGHSLHLGISAGALLYQVNKNKIRLPDPDNDLAYQNLKGQAYVDFSIGALYRVRKEFFIGLSIPQTLALNTRQRDESGFFAKERVRHIYLHGGGFIPFGAFDYANPMPDQTMFVLEPSMWIRYTPKVLYTTVLNNFPFSVDANVRLHYRQRFWIGGGYGTNGMLNTEFGIGREMENETKWQVGLAYGIPVGKKYLSLGHSAELSLAYYFY